MHILFSVRTVLWLTSNTRIDLKLVCQNKSDPFQLFKHNSGLQDYGTRLRLTIGPKCENPPKIDEKHSWNWRIILMPATIWQNFHMKCMHVWPETEIVSICWTLLGRKIHCLQVNVFSAGFSHLQPLLDGFRFRVTLPNHGICWLLCVANTNNKPIKIPAGLQCRVPAVAAPPPSRRRAITEPSHIAAPFKCHATRQPLQRWRHGMELKSEHANFQIL